jgi:DNA (cytosine-5)-methyltransferase 1
VAELTTGSLCSGYGGLDLAVNEVFGATTAWHAETDPNASTVLAENIPGVPNLGDITTVDFADLPAVDILTAGFPCQSISVAGRQKAHDDHRWLWPSVLRAVAAMTPRLLVLENVQNLVSIQRGFLLDGILDDLATAGYLARWCVLGACAVGGAHHRHRFFLVAEHVGGDPDPVRVALDTCGATPGRKLLPTPRQRDYKGAETVEARSGRIARGTAHVGYDLPTTLSILPADGFGPYAPAVAHWEQVSGRPAPRPTEPGRNGKPRMSPAFAEWMMGLPGGWVTDHLNRVPALRAIGNGVVPLQAAAAIGALLPQGPPVRPDAGTDSPVEATDDPQDLP